MVNEFSAGEFMETHYHSQFDSEAFYDEGVYRFHHQLYGSLVIALDHLAAAPLDFERVFYALQSSVDPQIAGQAAAWAGQERSGEAEDRYGILSREIAKAIEAAGSLRKELWTANARYRTCLEAGEEGGAMAEWEAARALRLRSMEAFQKEQARVVGLD